MKRGENLKGSFVGAKQRDTISNQNKDNINDNRKTYKREEVKYCPCFCVNG